MAEAAEDFKARMRSVWSAFRASVEPLGLDAFQVADATAGLNDLQRDILDTRAEPDGDLLAIFRAVLQGVNTY